MGADSLHDFPTWREPQRIVSLAHLAVVNRGGTPTPDLGPVCETLGVDVTSRVQFVTVPGNDVSSSDIRRRVSEHKSIRYMAPRAVECYIETHALYQ
jgi:nicotinate-nucleotide adenylyltransferase